MRSRFSAPQRGHRRSFRTSLTLSLISALALTITGGTAVAAPPSAPPLFAPPNSPPLFAPPPLAKGSDGAAGVKPQPQLFDGAAPIVEPPPPPDAFYDVPANLAGLRPGAIIRTRPVQARAFQTFPINLDSWQILYRTSAADGSPDAAVTTVMVPHGEYGQNGHAKGPRPLLSYNPATDSTLRVCDASYGLTRGFPIEFGNPVGPLTVPAASAEVLLAAAGLAQGWAVAMPDHGGIENRFLSPRQPGYAILDGIRAVESFKPTGLGPKTPVAMWGYSGGAIASSWAIEVQPQYAPELNIKGAAFGAPERDLDASIHTVSGTPGGGLIPVGLASIEKDSPAFSKEITKWLTPAGRKIVTETRKHCAVQNVLTNLWFDVHHHLTIPLDTFLAKPAIRQEIVARGISGLVPKVPAYIYNGVTEEVAPIAGTDRMVKSYCDGGAPVVYKREVFPPRPIPQLMTTHGVVLATGAPGAFDWLKHRLAPGAPDLHGCDIQTVPSSLLEPGSLAALGPLYITSPLEMLFGAPLGS